jgi:hypothetical protein
MALAMFFLLSSADSEFQQETQVEVQSSLDTINQRSALTTLLNDQLWRSPSIEDRYGDLKAFQITSYYLSTDDPIHIKGKDYSQEKVKEDLETYYLGKMNQHFMNRPSPSNFQLNISYKDKYVAVENLQGDTTTGSSTQVPIQLSDDRKGEIIMWVEGTGGVFSVE